MIQTLADLKSYIAADRRAYGWPEHLTLKERIVHWLFPDRHVRFMTYLRFLEYYTANSGGVNRVKRLYYSTRLSKLRAQTGIELSPGVAGPGLHLSHGKVVISAIAKIGSNCKILSDVTIGGQGRYDRHGAPQIGDRVFIGSGAKIIGNITIADDCVIGANAVVTKSITEPGTTWAGNPARKVSDTGSYHYLHRE